MVIITREWSQPWLADEPCMNVDLSPKFLFFELCEHIPVGCCERSSTGETTRAVCQVKRDSILEVIWN